MFRSNDYSTGRIVPLHQSRSAILLLTANDVVTAIGLFVTEVGQGMSDQALPTLRASLSGTFLQTLPDLVTPLKGHSLSPRNYPPTRSAPSEYDCKSNLAPKHARKNEALPPRVKKKKEFRLDSNDFGLFELV